MKPSDYISMITLAVAGTILAYFLTNSILGDPRDKSVSFEYLEPISAEVVQPDSELFNAGAINPTVEIYVGSCKDINGDGIIDEAELVECGQAAPETSSDDDGEEEEDESVYNDMTEAENEAINAAEGYARGTTPAQRQAVEAQINEYTEQQNSSGTSGQRVNTGN